MSNGAANTAATWSGQIEDKDTSAPGSVLTSALVTLPEFGDCVIRIEADGSGVVVSEERTGCYGEGDTFTLALRDLVIDMRQYRESLAAMGEDRLAPRLLEHLRFLSNRANAPQYQLQDTEHTLADAAHDGPEGNDLTTDMPTATASSQTTNPSSDTWRMAA